MRIILIESLRKCAYVLTCTDRLYRPHGTYKMSLIALSTLSLLVVMASSQPVPQKEYYDVENARPIFEKFIKDYNREYIDDADKETHYEAFVNSLKKINDMNKKSTTATFGINKFADYTKEESKHMFGFRAPVCTKSTFIFLMLLGKIFLYIRK